jgi:pyruvate/2-oxoglutarate dehydrogenase complex dihydrolipoamide acyltransferase (E2) component
VAAPAVEASSRAAAPAAPAADAQVTERAPGERLRASPLVKRLAEEHSIDLTQVIGTGPGGRIINKDIADFVSGAKPAPKAGAAAPTSAPSANGQVAPAAGRTCGGRPASEWPSPSSGFLTIMSLPKLR